MITIAYDNGGVTTSTVTVPLIVALGIGLASNIEVRSPLLVPIISVMVYSIISLKIQKK